MHRPSNPKKLQEYVLFNIIYYCGRRGHKNLRSVTKETFQIKQDFDGREFIVQVIGECDKNHRQDDTTASNEARIYANPDKSKFYNCTILHFKAKLVTSAHMINHNLWPFTQNILILPSRLGYLPSKNLQILPWEAEP